MLDCNAYQQSKETRLIKGSIIFQLYTDEGLVSHLLKEHQQPDPDLLVANGRSFFLSGKSPGTLNASNTSPLLYFFIIFIFYIYILLLKRSHLNHWDPPACFLRLNNK